MAARQMRADRRLGLVVGRRRGFDRAARLRLALAQILAQRGGEPLGLFVLLLHRPATKRTLRALTIPRASSLRPLPVADGPSAAVAQW